MDRIDEILSIVDYALGTRRKRHIVGGVLLSVSLLFGRPIINSNYIENGGKR